VKAKYWYKQPWWKRAWHQLAHAAGWNFCSLESGMEGRVILTCRGCDAWMWLT